jgi:hypothetical protein
LDAGHYSPAFDISMAIIKPPIHPKIYADESPLGYLKRLARINHYESYRWLLPEERSQRYLKENYLWTLLCTEDWTGVACKARTDLVSEDIKFIQMAPNIRVCPLCLTEGDYWRQPWHLKTSFCCSKHKVWLVDRCYSCEAQILRRSNKFTNCICKAWFGHAPVKKAPDSVVAMQRFIESSTFETSASDLDMLMPKLHGLSLERRIKLIELLARRVPNYTKLRRGTNTHLNSFLTAKDAVMDTANALFGGKGGFMSFLKTLYDMGTDNTQHSHVRLTLFYRDFFTVLTESAFSNYKALTEQFINQHLKGSLNRRHRLFSEDTINGHIWIPLAQAVRDFRIEKSKLRGAIEVGWIEARKEQKGKREFTLVNRANLESRIHWLKDQLTLKEAYERLGVTKKQMYQLLQAKEFKSAVAPAPSQYSLWRISAYEVDEYLKDILACCHVMDAEYASYLPIGRVMQFFGHRDLNLLQILLQNIRGGVIKAFIRPENFELRSILICRNVISNTLSDVLVPERVASKPECV